MEYCKVQIGCLVVVLYIAYIYLRECKRYHRKMSSSLFDELLMLGILCISLDGITAVTVNHLDTVNITLNRILHMLFLISMDSVIYMLFGYMLRITGALPKNRKKRIVLNIPYVLNVLLVALNIGSLEFREGNITNYSMGISAYTCFVMVGIYIIFTLFVFFKRWHYIESSKRVSILTYLLVLGVTIGVQAVFPETLITSVAVTVLILGIYMNQEDPVKDEVSRYHGEMIMGFATLVENKDGSTGGHIKRTTAYVKLLAEELRNRGYYKDVLTKDYIKNLCLAAPMHDIGKIAVPDVVLQKPGRLTDEEFASIKKHTVDGGRIVQETFGHLGDEQYTKMAYQVARYHHEKWNGNGYPEGLKRRAIPLCARIMAVADVFDAISEKRCYRDAMPMDKCFGIIQEGSGRDFDPVIAEIFLDIRDKVEAIHNEINNVAGNKASNIIGGTVNEKANNETLVGGMENDSTK